MIIGVIVILLFVLAIGLLLRWLIPEDDDSESGS